jgi:hypothetical protein
VTKWQNADSARRCRFRKSQQKRASDLDSIYGWIPKLDVAGYSPPYSRGLRARSTITTNTTRHLSQPPSQQTRQPSIRSPSRASRKSRRYFVSTHPSVIGEPLPLAGPENWPTRQRARRSHYGGPKRPASVCPFPQPVVRVLRARSATRTSIAKPKHQLHNRRVLQSTRATRSNQ